MHVSCLLFDTIPGEAWAFWKSCTFPQPRLSTEKLMQIKAIYTCLLEPRQVKALMSLLIGPAILSRGSWMDILPLILDDGPIDTLLYQKLLFSLPSLFHIGWIFLEKQSHLVVWRGEDGCNFLTAGHPSPSQDTIIPWPYIHCLCIISWIFQSVCLSFLYQKNQDKMIQR